MTKVLYIEHDDDNLYMLKMRLERIGDLEVLAAEDSEKGCFVTSVCTGALVLGAAGLLAGKHATTHWMSREMLPALGALSVAERVVVDGNVITGGGVTAGIDFALTVAAEAFGEDIAKSIQLGMEYDPHPPFDAGSPDRAGPDLVAKARSGATRRQTERQSPVDAAAAALRQAR